MSQRRIIYVTYADGAYEANLKPNAFFARYFLGASKTILLTRRDLEAAEIYTSNRKIFDAAKGRGYWAWKPWAILQALNQSQPGDVIIYQDCGFGLRYKSFIRPKKLVELAISKGFIAGVHSPQYGPNSKWTHRKCIESMGQYDSQFLDVPTVEAVVSLWPHGAASNAFVSQWLDHCLQFELISDPSPDAGAQHVNFVEHRYDQSILTNLVIKEGAHALTVDPSILTYSKSVSMLEIELRSRHNIFFRLARDIITRSFNSWHHCKAVFRNSR
jgi:hypothetical protein